MIHAQQEKIDAHQERTFRFRKEARLKNKAEAVDFINERGFILFHPSKDVILPSLWAARAGDRPVPNEHDDPDHITWQWKDELLPEKRCYYGRLLAEKMTFVSLEMLPYFFRLSKNLAYENDYLYYYDRGEMSFEARAIYEVLLEEGPMDTLLLRKKVGLWGKENQYRYTKTMNWLQTELMILPTGVAEVGRWNYGFIFDILPRHFPQLANDSLKVKTVDARIHILKKLLLSLGATSIKNIKKILRWPTKDLLPALDVLEKSGLIVDEGEKNDRFELGITLRELLL